MRRFGFEASEYVIASWERIHSLLLDYDHAEFFVVRITRFYDLMVDSTQ